MADEIKIVSVLGAGTIGASWTALFLAAGLEVDIFDPSDNAEEYVKDYIQNAWTSLEELGLVKGGASQDKLRFFKTPEAAVKRAQFIQESVPEDLEMKHELFQRIEPHLQEAAIVATSTSGLLVREMQKGWKRPNRFILGHPFNPPHLIPLVELLANDKTEDGVLEEAEVFYASCGKVTIRVNKEVPAHVANRLQAALWREAIHLVNEGIASVKDVDKAVWAGPGLRWSVMGPHMLFNLGSGGHGLEVFCERYGSSFHRWWDDMGDPRLTNEIAKKLADGVRAEEAGRSFDELSLERDAKIVAALKAMQEVSAAETQSPDKTVRKITAR